MYLSPQPRDRSFSCSGHECYDCIPSIAEAIAATNAGGATAVSHAVDVNSTDTSGIDAAIAAARSVPPPEFEAL